MAFSPFIGLPLSNKRSARLKFAEGTRLLIVGNGMVSVKFCQLMVQASLHHRYDITVIGEEDMPAYDRIRLSTFVDHRDASQLSLESEEWYDEHGITLQTGTRVDKLDRSLNAVHLSDGKVLNYDILILATGSRPFVPEIPGIDLPNVHVYRTISDIEAIISASEGKESATIIGGGLLGLEAAQAVQKLGLKPSVVERARFLMPQQLNESAAGILEGFVRAQEIELYLEKPPKEIRSRDEALELCFEDGSTHPTDLVIVSAGIVPESELAKEAGLDTGIRGGVLVNNQLETTDPNIFAIGECAHYLGRVYGLAAPGYAMAKHLVRRLRGERVLPFAKPDLSTRLKMLGVDVVTIGDPLDEGRRVEFSDEQGYRMLLLSPRLELLGALGVGEWAESAMIQSLYVDGATIRPSEIIRFEAKGLVSETMAATPVTEWPDGRMVCNCLSVSKGEILSCALTHGQDADRVQNLTGASGVCGSCRPLVEQLCGAPVTKGANTAKVRALLILSLTALLAVVVTAMAPPMEMADSVESWWYKVDIFWRDHIVKQVTGYGLMAVFLLGLLLSLRKRFSWFRFGAFASWRLFHVAFGVVALIMLFAHTGFRFGQNLNFWLMFTFVSLNLLGALAGVVAAIEGRGVSAAAMRARRIRPILTYAHLILFWPLPVLLTFHILSVYLY